MFYWAVALLLLPSALSHSSEHSPDRCWMNDNTTMAMGDVAGVCPLWNRNLTISVYCGLTLAPDKMLNERCRRCVWKENTEKLCMPTKHWQRRSCCCKRAMCNRQIYEDALPGWGMTVPLAQSYEQNNPSHQAVCIKARFNASESRQWKRYKNGLNYDLAVDNDNKTMCYMNLTMNGTRLAAMAMGMVRNKTMKDVCEHVSTKHGQCNEDVQPSVCCCQHRFCNRELFKQFGFDPLMDLRLEAEQTYKKNMENAAKRIKTKLWYKDEDYYRMKPTIDGCLLIGTAVYILVIMVIYRVYQPVDMDKRVRPDGASREIVTSLEKQ